MSKKRRKKAAGCFPQCHYQHAREYVDFDYIDKLSDGEAAWLAAFADNYYSGRFRKDDDENPLKDRKDGYNRGRRQRDDLMSGRSRSRVMLNEEGARQISEVDLGEFKKYLEKAQTDE